MPQNQIKSNQIKSNQIKSSNNSAFTLIELSIVLVIIGLIVAGVVGGQELIKQAKLRNVITQLNMHKTSVGVFKLKYDALPGDFSEATKYWSDGSADCYADRTGSNLTCDGDGSGKIAYINFGDTSDHEHESWHFWKHLELSGIIDGNFSAHGPTSYGCSNNNHCLVGGKNAPKGAFSGSSWFVFSTSYFGDRWQGRANNRERNIIAFTNPNNVSGNVWYGASLSAGDQYSIDKKIDDGKPHSGKLVDISGDDPKYSLNCAVDDNNTPIYNADFATDPNSANAKMVSDSNYNLVDGDKLDGSFGCVAFFDLDY